jgi:hypothetical protein
MAVNIIRRLFIIKQELALIFEAELLDLLFLVEFLILNTVEYILLNNLLLLFKNTFE